MKNTVPLLLICVLIITIFSGCGKTKNVVKEGDSVYSILQLTDVHIVNDEKKDEKAFKTIRGMIEASTPDLIAVTGDVTSEKDNLTAIKKFGDFIEQFNIPWAFTYGNHDAEGDASKDEIDEYLLSLDNCVYERGDVNVDGHGNYYRNVTDKNGNVITSLIFMDSNMYDEVNDGYDHFHDNQIEWYEKTVKEIATAVNGDETKVVPSLAFFHIPMQEFTTAYDLSKDDKSKKLWGFRFEKEFSPTVDDQMFEKMLELGSTKGVFVGHDHMNNYEVEYKGIRLTYGMSCDHNIYVVPLRGGKLIEISSDGTYTTRQLYRHRLSNNVSFSKKTNTLEEGKQ